MKKILFALLVAMPLVACDKSDDFMKCGDYEITTQFEGETLIANINGDTVTLTQAVSASGARYVGILNDTEVTLWNKGEDWTLILNDEPPIECE